MQESKTQDLFDIWKSNCLKGVAVIILLFHHCFLSPKRYTGHELKMLFLPERFLNIAAAYGKICVALFVFVSSLWTYEKDDGRWKRKGKFLTLKGQERLFLPDW